ncbi:MAG: hypothetical protein ACKJSG_19025, partial [Lentisphaeria bacterium]
MKSWGEKSAEWYDDVYGDKYLFRLDPSDPSTNREGRIKAEDQGRAWAFTGNYQRGSLRYDY